MLAILGLLSVALSAVMLTGADFGFGDDAKGDDGASTSTDTDKEPEIVSLDAILDDSAQGVSDQSGDDTIIFSGNGDDAVVTGDGDDLIDAEDGNDTVDGGNGDDELHGGRGDDEIIGGGGDDTLYGHVGDDIMFGGTGNDAMIGGDGMDVLEGGDGDDALQGYLGNDTLIGGNGTDVLFGGSGDDLLDGRDDDGAMDFLNGSAGDDVLLAGTGDHLNGGTGADVFGLSHDSNAYVQDFDLDDDSIEVAYDTLSAVPILRFEDIEDGVLLLADGEIVATFAGHTALDMASVPVLLTAV
ncbi:MAG: calcium-binding protein [Yoonia sp.]|nr:calcium-binding protein [Yoonia sp.]